MGKDTNANDLFVEAAHLALRKAGWSPRYDLEILRADGPGSKPIRYGYRADKVRLLHSPDLFDQVSNALRLVGEAGLGRPIDALYDVVASRVYLQIGSFKVCPSSIYDYYEILDASADGLRSAGANEAEVIDFAVPVTSLFIASVVSAVYGIEGPDPPSFRTGWQLDHIISSNSRGTTLQTYRALYANIQLRLWSDNRQLAEALRSHFPLPFDTLAFETDRGVAILLDSFEFVESEDGLAWTGGDNVQELILNELHWDWRSWPIKAFQWAEMIGPYLIAEQKDRQLPPRSQLAPAGRHVRPSDEARDRRNIVRTRSQAAARDLPWLSEQTIGQLDGLPTEPYSDRITNDAWFRQRLLQIGIGRGRSPKFMDFEALDALYRSRVTKVQIESEVACKKGAAFEIAHLSREELRSTMPGFNNIDWGATRIDPNGRLQLYEKKIAITDDTPAKLEMIGFPDLLFIVDSSGSMKWDPKAGTGPYDSLLRAVYSVLYFLERHGKAQYMRFAVVNFSGTTVQTPWLPFAELRKVKELLFKHQGGGTTLDCAVVRQIVDASPDRFLCLMVTDGQISNATDVLCIIKAMVAKGHGFVLIQIGRPSALTQQLHKAGLVVHIIQDHTQLEGLYLHYARKTW